MTQKQKDLKDLLYKDICGRLPYGVKVLYKENIYRISDVSINNKTITICGEKGYPIEVEIQKVKPCLFLLSNMTEKQKKHINNRLGVNENFNFEIDPNWGKYFVELGDVVAFINWCYENHLDINGLIPKGLSNDATGLNIY